eukprot:3928947-Prymnesium_polylepis.1
MELPPEHVYPSVMDMQSRLQPLPSTTSLSSQISGATRKPSPQTAEHASEDVKLPPEQTKPASMKQEALHPSPDIVLLSSHPSAQMIRMPSPQTGAHVSSPPTPDPIVLELVQPQPVSMRQSESQPSPPKVLLSSQISAVVRTPSPQMWIGGTTANVTDDVSFVEPSTTSTTSSAASSVSDALNG